MSRTCRGARIRGGFLAKGRAESFDLTKLPEGDGEQVLANVVVEGEPPVAVMPAAASRHVIIGGSVSNEEAQKKYPKGWKAPKPYLRIVSQPK